MQTGQTRQLFSNPSKPALISSKETKTFFSTAVKKLSPSATLYLVLTTRIAGEFLMTRRKRTSSTASPQNALSARLVMDPARRSTVTCLFTAIMNDRRKL